MKSMSLPKFKEEMGASIQMFRSVSGKLFFRCGEESGPISEKAQKLLDNKEFNALQMLYLEGDEDHEACWCLCPIPGEFLGDIL